MQFEVQANTGLFYQFDKAMLEAAIANDATAAVSVEDVLGEIQNGNLLTLHKYNINYHVVFSSGLPGPNGAANPSVLAGKLDSIDILQVLYALREASLQMCEAGRVMRQAQRDTAVAEGMNAAEKIRAAAMTSMVCNIVSGSVNIAMSAVSVFSSVRQMRNVSAASDALDAAKGEMTGLKGKELTDAQALLEVKQARYDRALVDSNAKSTMLQTINTGLGGATTIFQGVGSYLEANRRAEQAEHEAKAQAASSTEGEGAEFQKAAEELSASVRETVKGILQACTQANQAIYRNM